MHTLHGVAAGAFLTLALSSFFLQFAAYFWVAGIVFSLTLWLIVPVGFRRYLESVAGVSFTQTGVLVSLGGHLVYGASLGLLLQAFFV